MLEIFTSPDAWVALLTLTFLEIVLGIDNIVFISITTNKLPKNQQKKATNWGLALAMVQRIALLFLVSFLASLQEPFYHIDTSWISFGISGQAIILFAGGLFLLYKSTSEIHHKIDMPGEEEQHLQQKKLSTFSQVMTQLFIINIIFSIDSILTAVGMTNGLGTPHQALLLMIIAVVISIGIMMLFANAIRDFINQNPSMLLLALAFLILIGFMLITEAAHLAEAEVFGQHIGAIPKGYLYFAIAFSLLVEFLNMKIRKKRLCRKRTVNP